MPRVVFGVRMRTVVEVAAVLALLLVVDAVAGRGDRFASLALHPFWVPVLLAASYYGTRDGLAAALLAVLALVVGRQSADGGAAWPSASLEQALNPIGWFVGALLLGEIRDVRDRRAQRVASELKRMREHAERLIAAYENMRSVKRKLELRVAAQLTTVHAVYQASRAIDRGDEGEVILGISEVVRTILKPRKFSLYVHEADRLQAMFCEGWCDDDEYATRFDAPAALYQAIVHERRVVAVTNLDDERVFGSEGVLAGPIVEPDSGTVFGMLKIERIAFIDLNAATIQNFRILCEWIGVALANARRVERRATRDDAGGHAAASRGSLRLVGHDAGHEGGHERGHEGGHEVAHEVEHERAQR